MMRYVDLSVLRRSYVYLRTLEVCPGAWTDRRDFFWYTNTPRPCSGFFFICGDICATYYPQKGEPISIEKGDLLWIPAGECYYMKIDSKKNDQISTYTLNFQLLDENQQEVLLSDRILLLAQDRNHLFETNIRTLNYEIHRGGETPDSQQPNHLKVQAAFFSLLAAIAEAESKDQTSFYPIRLGVEALNNEWNQNRKIKEYAQMCNVSSAYFYQCFRQWSKKSPVAYRNQLRLSNAETMLRCTDMKVKEISEAVGFDDPFYFSHYFTQRFGVSPQKYRKMCRTEQKSTN